MGFTVWVLSLKRWKFFRNLEEIPWVRLWAEFVVKSTTVFSKRKRLLPIWRFAFSFLFNCKKLCYTSKKYVCVLISYGVVKICAFLSFLIKFNWVCFQNSFCNFVILIDSTRTIVHLFSFSSLFLKNWILHSHPWSPTMEILF